MTRIPLLSRMLNRRLASLCLLPVLCILPPGSVIAGLVFSSDTIERRVKISLQVFPRIIVVDSQFGNKVAANNIVNLAFVYDRDRTHAVDLRKFFLKKSQTVAGMTLAVESVSIHGLSTDDSDSFTGLFVTERLDDTQFRKLVEYAVRNQLILFSPFSGDVERGASAGISVTSRVKPYLNIETLQRSNIEINSLLMNMSKRHE